MKYTIESTENKCVETLKLSDGSTYKKIHKKQILVQNVSILIS